MKHTSDSKGLFANIARKKTAFFRWIVKSFSKKIDLIFFDEVHFLLAAYLNGIGRMARFAYLFFTSSA